MTPAQIIEILQQHDCGSLVSTASEGLYPHAVVKTERLTTVANLLRTDWRLHFDLLRCITATDWPAKNTIELSYDLVSVALGHAFAIKILVDRARPEVESISRIWPAAEWHEREAFDLVGVTFLHHPDPRRILLPDDWTGHPLRKDYQYPTEYKGLKLNP